MTGWVCRTGPDHTLGGRSRAGEPLRPEDINASLNTHKKEPLERDTMLGPLKLRSKRFAPTAWHFNRLS